MPYIEASFFEERFQDEEFSAQMVEAITQAVTSVIGEAGTDSTVILHGVPRSQWGHGGKLMG
ncbi:Phenylpyruvate tautomerase PptA, 4-oxalocrotonate tautomerase family [Pseudonocardia ammonioxydans]|uniref:Phenylpyruvate tautomerase PptA, 4-oxalocrotonate tautomerase family n=1 Tax=Pseudonocardia ammonioxydans TaxID=260086 RepID=A0A1I5HER2_PSUAM|nr:tautomerase family protein [Pseudonocardia ammonioxydans]SFO46476.1 Phenylpyruvate tautomerase PptA, 4-oxalocrotonate tautomerase family [Pseudonocardia ammonioxydans]